MIKGAKIVEVPDDELPEDGEDAAYLIGYIVMKMYKYFRHYICQ